MGSAPTFAPSKSRHVHIPGADTCRLPRQQNETKMLFAHIYNTLESSNVIEEAAIRMTSSTEHSRALGMLPEWLDRKVFGQCYVNNKKI